MGKAIGIDLGTTNSVAAFKWADMEVVTADDNTPPDRKLTRSVVTYEQGKLLSLFCYFGGIKNSNLIQLAIGKLIGLARKSFMKSINFKKQRFMPGMLNTVSQG